MKKTTLIPAALLAGVAWAGSATLTAPEIQDGNGAGDSAFVLDCNEPQSDSVYIWKCDSVFVEDSIAAEQNRNEPYSEGDPSLAYAGEDVAHTHSVVREHRVSGWTIFFWGVLEAIANSDNGDHCKPARASKRRQTLFADDTQRPMRERGTRRSQP